MHQDAPGSGEAAAEPVNAQAKSKKPVRKTIAASDFFSLKQVSNWADEADEVSSPAPDINALRERLPTAPKACREEEMEARAPHKPPFQCRMYNAPFDVTEDQVRNFLSGCTVIRVTNEQRGGVVVEFEDRKSLLLSFKQSGRQLVTRTVRIDLNEQRQNKGFFDNMGGGQGNRRSYDNQGGNRGGYRDFQGGQQGGSFRGRNSGGYYNRGGDHGGDRGGGHQQGGGSFYQPAGYHSNQGGESNTYQNFNSGYNRQRSAPPPALQLPSKASQESQAPSGLPGVVPSAAGSAEVHAKPVNQDVLKNLLKSVGSVEDRDAKHNPFGAARPVDTFAKELEMEKRLEAERQQRAKTEGQATSPAAAQGERPRHTSTGSAGQPQQGYPNQAQQQYYQQQQYGEQQGAWGQHGQHYQQYEGQQGGNADYQQQNAWGRQSQGGQYGQGAELNKTPSFDRSGMEMIGRSNRGGSNGYQQQHHGQNQQAAPVRHQGGSSSEYQSERVSDHQAPAPAPQPTLVPAPPPSTNPWGRAQQQKPAAATVSAKTKQVTTTENQEEQYYQQGGL